MVERRYSIQYFIETSKISSSRKRWFDVEGTRLRLINYICNLDKIKKFNFDHYWSWGNYDIIDTNRH